MWANNRTRLGLPCTIVLCVSFFSASRSQAGPATHLAFFQQPSNARAGTTIPAVIVYVEDATNTPVTGDNTSNVTLVIVSPATGGGTLTGTLTVTAVNGVATFSDLEISAAGTYTLQATSVGLTPATSVSFLAQSVGPVSTYTLNTLATFTNAGPGPGLVIDRSGNLFGTTYGQNGTSNPDGTVFEITAASIASGHPTANTVASFSGPNGYEPFAAMIMDGSGNLYGTTFYGGAGYSGTVDSGEGAVFELPSGSSTISALASFNNTTTGWYPESILVMDGSGNLYGTTIFGGGSREGTVFEVVAGSGAITTLANFNTNFGTGKYPFAGLIRDGSGNLYGTTYSGGTDGSGTVFEVTGASIASGSPVITTVASLNATSGGSPNDALIMDGSGNLYGTTTSAVFEITAASIANAPNATITPLVSVGSYQGLIMDDRGNIYGTSPSGGSGGAPGGMVFEITAASIASGSPAITPLVSFNGTNGQPAQCAVIMDGAGNLYGTTYNAATGAGTVFELTPLATTAPKQLVFSQPPTGTTAGTTLSPVSVQVVDASGSPVTTDISSVTVALVPGAGTGTGTLSGTLTQRVSAVTPGVATFNDLKISTAGTYELQATDTDIGVVLTPATSALFAITTPSVGPAAQLAFVHPPSNAAVGNTIAPPVTVAVEDSNGNVISSDTSSVTIAIGAGGTGTGTLSGTLTQRVSAVTPGVATFNDLTISAAGTYTLQVTDTDNGTLLTSATSPVFTISLPGAPAHLAFYLPPSNAAAGATIAPPVTVAVEDDNNNIVTTDTSSVTIAVGTGGTGTGTLSGTLTERVSAVTPGLATFSDLSISTATTGTYTLQATDTDNTVLLTPATSPLFTITAPIGVRAKLVYIQPPTNSVAGVAIAPPVTVAVEDTNNNVITADSSSITVLLGRNVGGGTFSGTLTQNAVHGIATFSNLSISNAGTYSIWAIDNDYPTLPPAISDVITIVFNANPPIVYGEIPAEILGPGGYAADGSTPIELQIVTGISGLNLSTVLITASRYLAPAETICDGSKLNPAAPAFYSASIAGPYQGYYDATANGNTTFKGKTYIYGTTPQDTAFVFEPDTDAAYDFEELVTVAVTATDWAGNVMVDSPRNPPLSVYSFPVDTRPFGWDVQVDGGATGNNYPATATSTDANGNSIIWVVWERPDPATQKGTIWLAQRKDDATNFGPEIQVTTVAANGDCHRPSVAITAGGTIYVAYNILTGVTNGSLPANVVGLVSSTTAAPTTWNALGTVSGAGAFVLGQTPAITFVNSTNTLYVAGVGLDPNTAVEEIGVATAVLPSATSVPSWTVTEVTTSAVNQISPAIAQDANGVVYIVWTYDEYTSGIPAVADTDIYGADSSNAFATVHQVTNIGNASFPAIATEASGNALHFVWAANGGMSSATIQQADTAATGGWPATPLTSGTNVLDGTTGISYADFPKVAVVGSGATAHVFVVWQDERQSSTPGATDIMFAEKKNSDGAFGTNIYLSLTPNFIELPQPNGASVAALGVTEDGEPYAAWVEETLPLPTSNSHIEFSEAMYSRSVGPQPAPAVVTPAGGAWSFTDPLNPHITEVDISVPNDALPNTTITLSATELRNPAQPIGGPIPYVNFTDGSGIYFTLTGGIDELLDDWVTVTITLPAGTKLPNPMAVYRLVPPTPPLGSWVSSDDWTHDGIQGETVVTDPVTGVIHLSFQTLHLSSFGVGLNYNEIYGALSSSSSGCSMSPSGEPDIFVLLIPLVALGFLAATRLVRRGRSTKV